MSNSTNDTKNCWLILEVENSGIGKKVELCSLRLDADGKHGGGEYYEMDWEGRKLSVSFQHYAHGSLNLGVYLGDELKLRAVCKAYDSSPMYYASPLGEGELLHVKVLGEVS